MKKNRISAMRRSAAAAAPQGGTPGACSRPGCVCGTAGAQRAPALAGTVHGDFRPAVPVLAVGEQGSRVPAVTRCHPLSPALQRQPGQLGRRRRGQVVPGVSRRGGTVWPLEMAVSLRFRAVLLRVCPCSNTGEGSARPCAVRLLLWLWCAQLLPSLLPRQSR